MILSWSHHFVFIKGRKVAGTSVECALSQICDEDDVVTPLDPPDEAVRISRGAGARNYSEDPLRERAYLATAARAGDGGPVTLAPPDPIFHEHMPLREVAAAAGMEVLGLPAVCVERHPYAKVVSWANHQLRDHDPAASRDLLAAGDQVRALLQEAVDSGVVTEVRNIDLYRRPAGDIRVRALRAEHLQDDLDAFLADLDEPSIPLPHLKRSVEAQAADIRDFLSPRRLRTLNRLFAEEFLQFGYEPL